MLAKGRTNPPGNEYDSEDDDQLLEEAQLVYAAGKKYRARVRKYENQAQYQTQPLYKLDEVVYLRIPGQVQPAGPYKVSAILASGRYKLKSSATGQELSQEVSETELLIPVP